MMTMHVQTQGFDEAEKMLAGVKGGYERAASKAINLGLRAGKTTASKLIRARYNIRAKDIKEQGLQVTKATGKKLSGALEARGNMLPVELFKPTIPKKPGPGKFISVAIVKSSGKKKLKSAFAISKGVGARMIMERRQDERHPIFRVMAIGVPHMIGSLKISKQVEESIADSTRKNLVSETNFQLNKAAAIVNRAPKKRAV